MPKCLDCRKLIDNKCSAYIKAQESLGRDLPPPPLGSCMIPIVEDYIALIKPGMRVLDIGCGSWNFIQKHCESVGADYEGIDTLTEYFGQKTVATRIENLANLSFENDYFDLVIGNQTMEHWAENGCTLQWGLFQCFRVCKPGGKVLMNVPIHFHGTRIFMLGELDKLRNLFALFSNQVSFHKWGYPSDPIPSAFPYPGYTRLQDKPAYVLDIHAVKDQPLPSTCSNRGASNGVMAELRNHPISYTLYWLLPELRKHSLSYNAYRALRKFGLVPKK